MKHKREDIRKICFNCASVYEKEDTAVLICPVCGAEIKNADYERIMDNVRSTVFHAWTRPKQYENDDSDKLYDIGQSGEILNFVALAIASGLIGNVSYDIIKRVIKKIASYIKSHIKTEEDKVLADFLNSPEKIEEFARYLSAYYEEFDNMDDVTKYAIIDEIVADQMSKTMEAFISKNHKDLDVEKVKKESPYIEKEILQLVLEIRNEVKKHRLDAQDCEKLWNGVSE